MRRTWLLRQRSWIRSGRRRAAMSLQCCILRFYSADLMWNATSKSFFASIKWQSLSEKHEINSSVPPPRFTACGIFSKVLAAIFASFLDPIPVAVRWPREQNGKNKLFPMQASRSRRKTSGGWVIEVRWKHALTDAVTTTLALRRSCHVMLT